MTLTSFGPANLIKRSAETHPLTWRLRDDGEPVWLDEDQAKNGYAAARKAFADMAQVDSVQTVKDAGLKGRGGAGFPPPPVARVTTAVAYRNEGPTSSTSTSKRVTSTPSRLVNLRDLMRPTTSTRIPLSTSVSAQFSPICPHAEHG